MSVGFMFFSACHHLDAHFPLHGFTWRSVWKCMTICNKSSLRAAMFIFSQRNRSCTWSICADICAGASSYQFSLHYSILLLLVFFFHHTTCESTCNTLSSSATNQGDNTVLVAQGGTATSTTIIIIIIIIIIHNSRISIAAVSLTFIWDLLFYKKVEVFIKLFIPTMIHKSFVKSAVL